MNQIFSRFALLMLSFAAVPILSSSALAETKKTDPLIARGRYLSVIGGCNDCHTTGFAHSEGKVPEENWLRGDNYGFRGPWGTTYPVNLRLYMQQRTEDQWVQTAKTIRTRPPMPAYALNMMDENDLRALYRFIRSLGEAGPAAPNYLPPTEEPQTPYFPFVPVMPTTAQK